MQEGSSSLLMILVFLCVKEIFTDKSAKLHFLITICECNSGRMERNEPFFFFLIDLK